MALHHELWNPLSFAGLVSIFLGLVALVVLYGVGTAIYNAYWHPLRHIPGPKIASSTRLVWAKHFKGGTLADYVTKAHEKYGGVVRIAPNELSFISGETAWQDIYGHRTGKRTTGSYLKDPNFFPSSPNGVRPITAANEADHPRQRRLIAHAFSDKALREQEYIIQQYVDRLVQRLHEQIQGEARDSKVNLLKWYNYTTFDVIADLTFGESFHCLEKGDYHRWVAMTFKAARSFVVLAVKRQVPFLGRILNLFQRSPSIHFRYEFFNFVKAKVAERMTTPTTRPDFMGYIMRHQDEKGMTRKEIEATLNTFMIAGSETSATTLSGATFFLTQSPDKMKRLVEEIRGAFQSESDITMKEVNKLPYLLAVLNESLRLYPPAPIGFPRIVPKGGGMISGYWVADKTAVYVSQYAANHSSRNFTLPNSFHPERWLGDARFADDKLAVFNPFSFGPRNCVGKNLALSEIRLILAKVLWNFDIELHPDTRCDWTNQDAYLLWEKPPLYVQLTPVVRE